MATLVLGDPPHELQALMERRRRAGLDRLDEVWAGVLHMVLAPSFEHATIESQLHRILGPLAEASDLVMSAQFNLGESMDDFRVPDSGLHRAGAGGTWQHTAALVIEIVSPGDETWEKLPFYAKHQVDEVLIVDPQEGTVAWLELAEGEYEPVERSGLIDLGPGALAEQIDWP